MNLIFKLGNIVRFKSEYAFSKPELMDLRFRIIEIDSFKDLYVLRVIHGKLPDGATKSWIPISEAGAYLEIYDSKETVVFS